MKLDIKTGKYIIAVSGGVDSMALLHMLKGQPNIKLVVAHFNHQIRSDSDQDQELVKRTTKAYKLKLETANGGLDKDASEDEARNARYAFLEAIRDKHNAQATITAHHQDDKIETALINLLRGTGRQGLSSISNNSKVIRPLLNVVKADITNYAKKNNLAWREDSTNQDTVYLRNYLRVIVLPKLGQNQKEMLIRNIDKVAKTNKSIDDKIATLSQKININDQINRELFSNLPVNIGNELMAYWLRQRRTLDFDKRTVDRLTNSVRTAKPGTKHAVKAKEYLQIDEKFAHFRNTLQKR